MQNEYYECADLILSHYPDQIDHLLALVFSDKIPEAKMQQLLNYLSKNSTNLLSRVLSKLASNTCMAGMELLRYNQDTIYMYMYLLCVLSLGLLTSSSLANPLTLT